MERVIRMLRLHSRGFDGSLRKTREPDFLTVLHRVACVLCGLLAAYLLLRCCLSFGSALQDVRKFEHTDTFPCFLYFLDEENFGAEVCVFLLMAAEYWAYIVRYRRAESRDSFRGSILYFSIMLVIHAAVCLHANSLALPNLPPYTAADEAGLRYRTYANMTVLPPVMYFTMYLVRMWKYRRK